MNLDLQTINEEVNTSLANEEVKRALLATTFKGLDAIVMKRAILEGIMRGFTFKDFLERNVYAIPFAGGYSLVTSIDYARKTGQRSGIVGKSDPIFTEDKEGKIETCTITVKKKTGEYIGDYTATVYFGEYTTGRNLWTTKPHTMIAKVAEMHALRMACPEELAQSYVQEELEKPVVAETKALPEVNATDLQNARGSLEMATTQAELKKTWVGLSVELKNLLGAFKDEMKAKLGKAKKPEQDIREMEDATEIDFDTAPFPTKTKKKVK